MVTTAIRPTVKPQTHKRIISKDDDPCAVFVHNNTQIAFEGTRIECRRYVDKNRINIFLIANKNIPNWKDNAIKSIFEY